MRSGNYLRCLRATPIPLGAVVSAMLFTGLACAAQAQPNAADDIRDIHGPLAAPAPWWDGLGPHVGLLLACALCCLLGLALRRFLQRPKSPSQLAIARIDAAEAQLAQWGATRVAEEVTEAVRALLEARFSVHAPRRTTEELLSLLASDPESPLRALRARLSELLVSVDLVKYAGAGLDREEAQRLASLARELVHTMDAPPHEAEPAVALPGAAA